MNNQTISNRVLQNFQGQDAVRQNHSFFGHAMAPIRMAPTQPRSPSQAMSLVFGMAELVVTEHNFFGRPISQLGEPQKPNKAPVKKPWTFVLPQATVQKAPKAA